MPIIPERLAYVDAPAGAERQSYDVVAWAIAASLLVHALIYSVASLQRAVPVPVPDVNIPVELLSPEQYETETRPRDVPVGPVLPRAALTPGDSVAPTMGAVPPPEMIRPARMLSAAALASPGSRQVRAMLPTVDPTERSVQLCNIEAVEQVRAWNPAYRPERVVPYAMADLAIAGDAIHAEGAAVFSGGEWYRMRFDCGLSPDHRSVVAFAFSVGGTIPHQDWEAYRLPSGEDFD